MSIDIFIDKQKHIIALHYAPGMFIFCVFMFVLVPSMGYLHNIY